MKKRWIWLGAIALSAIILFTLMAAPGNDKLNSGSTYSRSPDGYGAWYAFMEKQGTPVKRWQKPFEDLPGVRSPKSGVGSQSPITLLRVNNKNDAVEFYGKERDWVKKGNTLVILGVQQPVTPSVFSTRQDSPQGKVKIETQRRRKQLQESEKSQLADRFGAIVWEQQLGKGRIISATTPHLAANAYQDESGNYQFLATLLTQSAGEKSKITSSIWVDEYIHGYKDKEITTKEDERDWLTYLAKTPLSSAIVQVGVILLVLVLASNRRFGQPLTLASPIVDNSEAYIQALSGVLQKADRSEFILEVLGKEEQLQLQKALGLGTTPVDRETLINGWMQQTGRTAAELEQVLQLQSKKHRISESELLNWLGKWQTIRIKRERGTGNRQQEISN